MARIAARLFFFSFLMVALLLAFGSTGCGNAAGGSGSSPTDVLRKNLSAEQVARRMIAAYQEASSYQDRAVLRVAFRQSGTDLEQVEELRVAGARPNQCHVKAYNVELASDGKVLRYHVLDELSDNMDKQFVERSVPERLDFNQLADRDPILDHFISGGAGPPVQLELLFSEDPLNAFFAAENQWKHLGNSEFDGHVCHQISVRTSHGKFVLWIDQAGYLLRKLVFPAETFLRDLAEVEGVSQLQLVAEFHGATFDKNYERGFDLIAPSGAQRVQYFVTLPPPLPTDKFGERPKPFHFSALDGSTITQADLSGELVVLLWFGNQPASQFNLQELQSVSTSLESPAGTRFLAVCTEPTTLASHQDVRKLTDSWGVQLPVVRDLEPFGQREFGIRSIPTLVVLDGDGRVQYFEVLEQPHLQRVLPVVIDRLLAGDDLAAEILREHREELDRYKRDIAIAATGQSQMTRAPVNTEQLKIKTPGSTVRLRHLWTCDELAAPGNVLVPRPRSADDESIFVVDGWRSVAQLDRRGRLQGRYALDLPDRSAVTYLRSTLDSDGNRWYVATEILAKQLHIFQADWSRVASFPRLNQQHGGIRDVQFADPDGDGEPEVYAAFWEKLGVQQLSLRGKRLGENVTFPGVLSILEDERANSSAGRLLATDGQGSLMTIDHSLSSQSVFTVGEHPIEMVFAADCGETERGLCGLYHAADDTLVVVGLNGQFRAIWQETLATGVFQSQIQFVGAAHIRGQTGWHWLIARPDASVHVISSDGSRRDRIEFTSTPTGMAVAHFGDETILLLACASGVSAWSLHVTEATH